MRYRSKITAPAQLVVIVGLAICLSALSVGVVAGGQPFQEDSAADAGSAGVVAGERISPSSHGSPIFVEEPQQSVIQDPAPELAADSTTAQASNGSQETQIQVAVWEKEANNPPEGGSLTLRDENGTVVAERDLFDSAVQSFVVEEGERYSVTADIRNWPERSFAFEGGVVDEREFVIGYDFQAAGKNYRWEAEEDEENNNQITAIEGVRLANGTHSYLQELRNGGSQLGDDIEQLVPGDENVAYIREGRINGNESTNYWTSGSGPRTEYSPDLPIHRPAEVGLGDYSPESVGTTTIDGMEIDIFEIDLSNDPEDDYASEYDDGLAYVNRDTGYVVRVETDLAVRFENGGYEPIFGTYVHDFYCHTCGDDIDLYAPIKDGRGLPPGFEP